MKIAVRYYTRSGNTKKLAESIAEAVGVKALPIIQPLTENVDILFLGSSVYASGVAADVKKFIASIDCSIGTIINFSTAAKSKSTYERVKKLADEKGIKMSEKEYHCLGSYGQRNKGKPDKNDLQNAAIFAKEIVQY
ncbi:flavodoxin family protein [Methanococcoides alaskense]|uniref:Flavodoxin n=1 Tax=Methanococcoides alaskense TaxID=325778 RepID=A0AA90TXF2_9EURY|nr:flavodoxin family protein [Methanococcoides alaskense]MDA0525374.1 hypothetical protein [Methanococcoides alaskense]MDR6221695.1 flavodoxin [Methanococcoides alaskense]